MGQTIRGERYYCTILLLMYEHKETILLVYSVTTMLLFAIHEHVANNISVKLGQSNEEKQNRLDETKEIVVKGTVMFWLD